MIRTPDARRARVLQTALSAADLSAVALIGPAAVRPAPDGEDIAVLDGEANNLLDLTRQARAENCAALAFVGAVPLARGPRAGVDAWVALDAPPAALRRTFERIYRDGLIQEESRARRRTTAALGFPPAAQAPMERGQRVMFVGAPTPAYLPLERAWTARGGALGGALTSFGAFDYLHDGRFDAVVLSAENDPAAALSLLTAMRRNTDLHDTPVMVIAKPSDEQVGEDARKRGADWVCAPSDDLVRCAAWLSEDIRRARVRRHALDVTEQVPAPEAPWALHIFAAHLETLAAAHHDKGRPLALGCLRVLGAPRTEAGARGLAELGGLMPRLVRACDSIGAFDGDTWLLAMPATHAPGAVATLDRMISVFNATAFVAGDRGEHAPLRFFRRACELSPGESGPGLLTRVVDALEGRERRA